MSGWKTKQPGHYPDYEMITIDEIINKECIILKCELDKITTSDGDTSVVHFLAHFTEDDKIYEVRTGAVGIVRTITSMAPEELKKVLAAKERTKFTKQKTQNGYTMYVMD